MKLEAKAYGEISKSKLDNDIVEVFATYSGLRIILSTPTEVQDNLFIEVMFSRYCGYRFLDEGDLLDYWESQAFQSSHHVYEITNGGWLSGEPLLPGRLIITKFASHSREWLVVSANGCITVLSDCEPQVREIES